MPSATLDRRAPDAPAEADAPTDWLRGTPPSRIDVLTASLVSAVVLVVAWVWRSPIVPTDPWHYVQRALTFPDTVWIPLGYTRYGIIIPNIVPAKLFGNAEASYYFWQMISIGVLAASVYLIGRRWWGHVAGLVAVVVLFSNSVVFYNLTRQYPDVMSMSVIFFGVLCALQARDRDFRGWLGVFWTLAAGFCVGWSFEVRETALFAWPLILVVLWKRGSVLRALSVAALPVLFWAAVDVGVSTVAYGDPMLKLKTLLGFGAGRPLPEDVAEAAEVAARTRWDYLMAIPRFALENRPDGVWIVATGVLTILAVLVRNRPLRLMSLSFIWVYALNLAAGGVIFPDRVFGDLFNIRYWIQYVPSIALVVGGLTALAAGWVARRVGATSRGAGAAVAAVAAVVVLAVPAYESVRTVPTIEAFAANGGDGLEQLRDHLGAEGYATGTVWTDVRTVRLLPIFQRPFLGGEKTWTGKPKKLDDLADVKPGDSVLFYSAHDDTCFHCRIQIQPWIETHPNRPENWELVFATPTKNIELYRVR